MAKAGKEINEMSNRKLENKIRQDITRVKKDLETLAGHSVTRVNEVGDNLSEFTGDAKTNITTWAEENISEISKGLEQITRNAKDTVVGVSAKVKEEVGNGLHQYNTKVQELANKVPGSFGRETVKYPWVTVTIAVVVGFILGMTIRPARL